VRGALERLFGVAAIEADVNPEEIVACGAAVQAGILAGEAKKMALVDVTPLGLGVETADLRMVTLIRRNTVLPSRSRALFTTVVDNQRAARIGVLQGERPRAEDNILLGSFRLEGIRQDRRGRPDIEVCFEIDIEGIVHVSALDRDTGSSRSIKLDGMGQLSEETVANILTEARAAELEEIYELREE
jgi:molecular chaperone DnaK